MKSRTNQPVFKDDGSLLKDSDLGDKLPAIEEGDAGKVIAVNEDEDGYELQEVSGGTKLYYHSISFSTGDALSLISTISEPLTIDDINMDLKTYINGVFLSAENGIGIVCNINPSSTFIRIIYMDDDAMEMTTAQLTLAGLTLTDTVTPL